MFEDYPRALVLTPDRWRARHVHRPGASRGLTPSTLLTRMAVTDHWLNTPHWSTDIPLDTPHPRVGALVEHGYVVLRDLEPPIPESEYLGLEYMDWKSGGDTNFAPDRHRRRRARLPRLLEAGRGAPRQGRPVHIERASAARRIVAEVESVGADFGRVRVIKLEPQPYDEALRQIHRDDNNRFNPDADGWVVRSWIELTDNPDSFMVLMEQGADGLPDPSTEVRVPLHRGRASSSTRSDSGTSCATPAPSRATRSISSFESGPALEAWIDVAAPLST